MSWVVNRQVCGFLVGLEETAKGKHSIIMGYLSERVHLVCRTLEPMIRSNEYGLLLSLDLRPPFLVGKAEAQRFTNLKDRV